MANNRFGTQNLEALLHYIATASGAVLRALNLILRDKMAELEVPRSRRAVLRLPKNPSNPTLNHASFMEWVWGANTDEDKRTLQQLQATIAAKLKGK